MEAPARILMTGCGICVPIASIMTSRITIGEVVNQPRSPRLTACGGFAINTRAAIRTRPASTSVNSNNSRTIISR